MVKPSAYSLIQSLQINTYVSFIYRGNLENKAIIII